MAHHTGGGPAHGKSWIRHCRGNSKDGGKKLIILALSPENCMKLRKKLDRDAAVIAPPLGSVTALTIVLPKNCSNFFGFLPLDQRALSPCRFRFCCRIHRRSNDFCHIFCLDPSRFILVGSSLLFQFHQVGHDVSLQLNQRACRSTVLVPTYYSAKFS